MIRVPMMWEMVNTGARAGGTGPHSMALLLTMTRLRLGASAAQAGGMVLVSVLSGSSREERAVRVLQAGGRGPVRALPCRSSEARRERVLQAAGRGPVRPALRRVREVSVGRWESSLGRGPTCGEERGGSEAAQWQKGKFK